MGGSERSAAAAVGGGLGAYSKKLTEFACAASNGGKSGGSAGSVTVEGYNVNRNGLVKCWVLA